MICKKCSGQGVRTVLAQRGETEASIMAAVLTFGLSLPFTTTLEEEICPRCGGTGEVGRR